MMFHIGTRPGPACPQTPSAACAAPASTISSNITELHLLLFFHDSIRFILSKFMYAKVLVMPPCIHWYTYQSRKCSFTGNRRSFQKHCWKFQRCKQHKKMSLHGRCPPRRRFKALLDKSFLLLYWSHFSREIRDSDVVPYVLVERLLRLVERGSHGNLLSIFLCWSRRNIEFLSATSIHRHVIAAADK